MTTRRNTIDLERRLVRLLVSTRATREAAADEIAMLATAVDDRRLVEELLRQRLLVVAGRRLADEVASWDDPSVEEQLRKAIFVQGAQAMLLDVVRRQVDLALEGEVLFVKGIELSEHLYGDPGARGGGDLDCLVATEHLEAAVEAVAALGFEPDVRDLSELPSLHVTMHDPTGGRPNVEIHWRIHWYEQEFSRAMLARATVGQSGRLRARPEDELAALLLFFARDGFVGLRLAADIATWWDLNAGALPPDGLTQVVRDHPALAQALRAAARVAHEVVGLPVVLGTEQCTGRARAAVRLENWRRRGSEDQVSADVKLIDLLLTPKASMGQALRRSVLVDKLTLSEYYDIEEGKRLLQAWWTAAHPVKMLVRFAFGLSRWWRRPWAVPGRDLPRL